MKKLNPADWFPGEDAYEAARREFIANYTEYVPGASVVSVSIDL